MPPCPAASGSVLVEKNGSKIRRRSAGAMPTPVSVTLISARRPAVSSPRRSRTTPPPGIAWRALIKRLNSTCWIWAGLTRAYKPACRLHVQPHAVPRHVFLDQHDDFLDQPRQVGRLAVLDVAGPRQAQHPARDRGGSLRGIDDLGQGPLTIGGVGIAQPELGVVEDRRQGVVQLVEHAAGQDAQAADPLQRDHLPAQAIRWPQLPAPSADRLGADPEPLDVPADGEAPWGGGGGGDPAGSLRVVAIDP